MYKMARRVKSCNTTAFWLHFVGSGDNFAALCGKVLQFLWLSWADLVLTVAIWVDFAAMLGYAATSLATVGGALSSSTGGGI